MSENVVKSAIRLSASFALIQQNFDFTLTEFKLIFLHIREFEELDIFVERFNHIINKDRYSLIVDKRTDYYILNADFIERF